ncbi:MAG: hypothetical protein NDJ90_06335 [Oligoflexia bacterium]|nr:hypothetical protein [Oligoflexia bacterium]
MKVWSPAFSAILAFSAFGLTACTSNTRNALPSTARRTTATPTTTSAATIVSGGVRAARIIFKATTDDDGGSFYPPTDHSGTLPGVGYPAIRVFDAAGNRLGKDGPGQTGWPAWLGAVELGLTGTNSGTPAHCARFADTSDTSATCQLGGVTVNCGAPDSYYRVSEYDCTHSSSPAITPATVADGTVDGNVFIRATFNRDTAYLGTGENILAVLEYAASGLNAAPADPSACFASGVFKPEKCSDLLWQSYLKKTAGENISPFLMLLPPLPSLASVASTSGSGITTRQILLPLSGDPELRVFQVNRVKTTVSGDAAFTAACAPGFDSSVGANSPHCVGAVLVAITFYRI